MRITYSIRFALSLVLLASSLAWAAPLSTTGRTGISEFYIRFGLQNFPGLVRLCLGKEYCNDEFAGLAGQLESAAVYRNTYFDFQTSRELGSHLYRLDPGGVITINRDMLFIARNGVLSPYVFSDAVNFLANVWGERLGWTDSQVRLVAFRLTSLATQHTERVFPLEGYLKQFAFAFIRRPVSTLVIEDTNAHELASAFEVPFAEKLSCGTSTGVEAGLRDLTLITAIWTPSLRLGVTHALLTVSGTIAYNCPQANGNVAGFTSNYQVQVDADSKLGVWYLNLNSVRIQQNGIRPE